VFSCNFDICDHTCTLRLPYNVVVGVHGGKRVIMDRFIYPRALFKIFNATPFTGFHMRKQMPPPTVIKYGISSQCI